IAARLHGADWDMIICSDLKRAKQTAERIEARLQIPIHGEEPRLRERAFGILEGTTRAERIKQYGTARPKQPQGAESDEQLRHRAIRYLNDTANQFQGKRILMVTHGGWIFHAVAAILDENPIEHPQNTSLTVLEKLNDRWTI